MDTSAESSISATRTTMTVGAITAAAMLTVFAVGLPAFGWLVFAGGIYYGMKRFRKEAGGYIGYFKALFTGIQTAFFTSVILAFVSYVTTVMEPSSIDKVLEAMYQQLKASSVPPGLTDVVMQQWREMLSPVVLGMITILTCTAIGCMIAVICAFFIRNDQPRAAR